MAQIVFNHVGGKPPFFDGTSSFDYWKRKIIMYLGSINDRVWEVMENDFVILDPANPTDNERANKQCNTMALNTIYNGIDSKVFEQVKDLEKASEVWTRCWHFLASLLKIDHRSILSNGTRNVACWHTITITTSER